MYYAPHILEVEIQNPLKYDEYGRPVKGNDSECYYVKCRCRCDISTTEQLEDDNGRIFKPKYHVICEGKHQFDGEQYAKCYNGDNIVGEGMIRKPKPTSYFDYTEIWLE